MRILQIVLGQVYHSSQNEIDKIDRLSEIVSLLQFQFTKFYKYHIQKNRGLLMNQNTANDSFMMNPSESAQMLDWLKIVHLDNLDLSFSSQTSSLSVKGMDIEMEWSFSGDDGFERKRNVFFFYLFCVCKSLILCDGVDYLG